MEGKDGLCQEGGASGLAGGGAVGVTAVTTAEGGRGRGGERRGERLAAAEATGGDASSSMEPGSLGLGEAVRTTAG